MDVTLAGWIPARNDGAFTKCRHRLPTIGGRGLTIRRIPFPCGISMAADAGFTFTVNVLGEV